MNNGSHQDPRIGNVPSPLCGGVASPEAVLAAVLRASPVGVGLLSGNIVVEANPQLCSLTGLSYDELVGGSFGRLFLQSAGADHVLNQAHDQLAGKTVARLNADWVHSNGRDFVVELTFTPVTASGTVQCWLFTALEVTPGLNTKVGGSQYEDQPDLHSTVLETIDDAVIVRDFADKISYWSAGATRMHGWGREEVLGRTLSELVFANEAKRAAEAFRMVQDHGAWVGEMECKSRDGEKRFVQSRWTLLRNEDGSPKGILIINSDRTQLRLLEGQLLRAQRLESIGTLASGLAHDLNNVLAPILMSVHMLKEEATDDSMRVCLDMLETCARRGSDIVSQVLMFARGVEGRRMPVHPKHLMKEVQRIVTETFPRGIRLEAQICKETPLIECDATQIQQLLMNLCVNARDAMPNGGTLTLRTHTAELGPEAGALHPKARPNTYVVLSVKDTGNGISAEVRERMFEPFFTTKRPGQGTGLGLPIVRSIAESHGGFVQVESRLGQGTTFRVYLPAAVAEIEKLIGNGESLPLPQGNGETVLVVDDEPAIRRIVVVILLRNGYHTLVAADGREALTAFHRNKDRVTLMVSDLMMPRQDGPTAIRAIRSCKPGLRVLAMTGVGEESSLAEARAAGVEVFLKKPFTAQQLLAAVKQLVIPANS